MKIENLPEWAVYDKDTDRIVVDPDVVYPMQLKRLGKEATQSSLEVARRCFTEDLKKITGPGLQLRILNRPEWKLCEFEPGKAMNWRTEYARIQGKEQAD